MLLNVGVNLGNLYSIFCLEFLILIIGIYLKFDDCLLKFSHPLHLLCFFVAQNGSIKMNQLCKTNPIYQKVKCL